MVYGLGSLVQNDCLAGEMALTHLNWIQVVTNNIQKSYTCLKVRTQSLLQLKIKKNVETLINDLMSMCFISMIDMDMSVICLCLFGLEPLPAPLYFMCLPLA